MKYIRTKDGFIFETEKNLGKYGTSKVVLIFDMQGNVIDLQEQNNILKQADTIEELCDEWVIVFKDGHIMFDIDYEDFEKEWFKHKHNNIIANHFGAIWTDKGLIYVAKMNDKGELELIYDL